MCLAICALLRCLCSNQSLSVDKMLWEMILHILLVICWMAGFFYVSRIFVHFVEERAAAELVDRMGIA